MCELSKGCQQFKSWSRVDISVQADGGWHKIEADGALNSAISAAIMDVQGKMAAINGVIEQKIEQIIDHKLDHAMVNLWEEFFEQFEELKDQIQSFMLMFVGHNLVRLSAKFPPRERWEPVLFGHGTGPRTVGLEAKTMAVEEVKNG